MREATQAAERARRWFIGLWVLLLALKLALAARLPLFVDEAFYWQEGMHLAWAYSDLPGLSAWLARLGVEAGGHHLLALRLPGLLLAAWVPWLVARIARRESGAGWQAGTWALLLPLAGSLGLLALPDVALAVASLLCLDAGCRLLHRVDAGAAMELALGLVVGGLAHYRFAAVVGVGLLVLLWLPRGRQVLRDWRTWLAVAAGALAWLPLLYWNLANAEAGLRFQLVDRHPWAFHGDGIVFVLVQALLVTPLLFAALAHAAWRHRHGADPVAAYLARSGALLVLGFFVLGFFADSERSSFHWPLPGYLALLPLLPATLRRWRPGWRRACMALAAIGLAAMLAGYAVASTPALRARLAATKAWPGNFAGWAPLADAVRELRARMPDGTRIVAGSFKVGAELGFALGDPGIAVLPHPLNRRHGREPQLALWDLLAEDRAALGAGPVLLAIAASDVEYKDLLAHYHELCVRLGPLPPPRVVDVDHGAQRFLLFALPAPPVQGPCTTPAMAWIDAPDSGAGLGPRFEVAGWAFKDGVGIEVVEVTLDGKVVARADYGIAMPLVASFWKISTDPGHPRVGFRATVDASGLAPGRHWLGLRLHGRDGSVETWREQPIDLSGSR
ncbi:MAG: glycosyltransferase family 39 protein [Pseudomonadota bacterium]|nr:glycosyltransferase family 39 protein [Pseudomonadota bacterium]